jgi:hypothetical protein
MSESNDVPVQAVLSLMPRKISTPDHNAVRANTLRQERFAIIIEVEL